MNNRHLTLSLAVALALASPCAQALGLGPLQVKSGLNQPLVAEIPIISATANELDQLDVRLASPDAFARVGLERPRQLTANLQFSLGYNASGQPVIRISTTERFNEPLLSFLIEAEWGKGTVTREYTALIDPPYIAPAIIQPMLTPAIAAAPAPVVAPSPPATPVPVIEPPQEAETAALVEPEPAPVVATPAPAPPVARPVPPPPEARPAPPVQAQARPPQPPAPSPAPRPAPAPTPAPPPAAIGEYGPVRDGQTLWAIANSVRPESGVSVNQMMVALLRANPDAFAQENINRLKRGSVLRVPGAEEVNRLSTAEATALVSQQAAAWRAPREAVPQPAETPADRDRETAAAAPAAARPAAAPRVAGSPARANARLEIVPPSGEARATGSQSGAAAGAGGSELRAELVQAREDLAARTSEAEELKSRIADLEKQDADRQRLIEMQNSQLKDLQDRLARMDAEGGAAPAAAAPAAAAPADAVTPAAAAEPAIAPRPWYMDPFVLGGAVLLLLGGLVLALRRGRSGKKALEPTRRLSEDDALRASMAKARESGERIPQEPTLAPAVVPAPAGDKDLESRQQAVRARPHDLEAHLNLLRLHHSRGNAVDYEVAAQTMRAEVGTTMDPRWREAVVMGASLMPGHALFSPAGWNSPRFSEPEAARAPEPASAPAPAVRESVEPVDYGLGKADETQVPAVASVGSLDLDEHDAAGFGSSPLDVHRNEAELMAEDEASATRIELARAYLDIGDMDGARSMLEEVLAEGGPSAQAEAARLLKDMG